MVLARDAQGTIINIYSSKKQKVFYGYWIVLAAFLLVFVHSGVAFFAFGLFLKPLQASLGWSRGSIMTAFTIWYLLSSIASPFIGKLADNYGIRRVVFFGALIGSIGFVLLSRINHLWQFYLSYALVGAGMAAVGHVTASKVVSNWFHRQRGLAIGLMSTGTGIGGLVLSPLIGAYLIPSFGWRTAYLVSAAITSAIALPVTLFLIREKPGDLGLHPDGQTLLTTPGGIAPPSLTEGLTLKKAMMVPAFWLIGISFLAHGFSQVGTVQNQVAHFEDIGFPVAVATSTLALVGLGSAVGKFSFGWLCDWIAPKYVLAIGLGLGLISITLMLTLSPASSPGMIWLYAILMGLSAGSWLPTMSLLTSRIFGLASYGAIFGTIALFHGAGVATGPFVAGYLYDMSSSYRWAFVIFLALYTISIPAILLVRRPNVTPAKTV